MSDPIASADALIAAIEPGLSSPGVQSRDVVLVTGPWLAGTSSLLGALRERLPDVTFVETGELSVIEAPLAVVFVVSAVARLTESDCALLDVAAANTDLVIGVVSKIDVHRNWRDVLAADRQALIAHDSRYRDVPWIGVAAAPDLGDPKIDELAERLGHLGDARLARRNRLRAWETRLQTVMRRYEEEAEGVGRNARIAELREQRSSTVRERRLAKTERAIALRSQTQQARVQLTYFARNRCTSVRAELQEDASNMGRRRLGQFEGYVRTRAEQVVDEVDEGITTHLGDMAAELDLPAPPSPAAPSQPEFGAPPLKSRRLETQLMTILGAGFGLGVALVVTRLFAGLAPGLTVAGLVAGVVVGVLLMVWVVGIRGLLHDRAVLDRWITDVTTALRSSAEERVATRVLTAETALTSELTARDEAESATAADRIAAIDAELREHAIATARAAAVRDRRLPSLQKAVAAVHEELYGAPATEPRNGSDGALTAEKTESPN
ncbi:hypothetical protein [Mycobacterium sp.]|uniref:hypothetical protein n=1 Tax=Mycobacterium sp. TaxID=1785 RepID=UPI002DA78E3E|nr:hypothetical protein [Mycobacterium sp.]